MLFKIDLLVNVYMHLESFSDGITSFTRKAKGLEKKQSKMRNMNIPIVWEIFHANDLVEDTTVPAWASNSLQDIKANIESVAVHLFCKALRLHDNEGFAIAAATCSRLIPLYIFDVKHLNPKCISLNRIDMILQSLVILDEELREMGSCLFVGVGDTVNLLTSIVCHYSVCKVTYEKDHEPVQKEIYDALANAMKNQSQVEVCSYFSYTLFDLEELSSCLLDATALLSMKGFMDVIDNNGQPKLPIAAPNTIPPPPGDVTEILHEILPMIPFLSKFAEAYGYSTFRNNIPFYGGEKQALQKVEDILHEEHGGYEISSGLSPYLAQGSLSVRFLYRRLQEEQSTLFCHEPKYFARLRYNLFLREFAHVFSYMTPDVFNHYPANPICLCFQIPWHVGNSPNALLKDCEKGQTGYPGFDAVINQLKSEGYLQPKLRMFILSFLTRGLFLSWRSCMNLLGKHSLDFDWAINGYNWHHFSCTTFYLEEAVVAYDPVEFFKMADDGGQYIRKYLPVLKPIPDKYIFEPWEAPLELQREANCVVGVHYPEPIVDYERDIKKNLRLIRDTAEKHFLS